MEEINPGVKEERNITSKVRENPWMLATIVLGVVVLVFLISSFTGAGGGITGNVISSNDVGEKVLAFYEGNGVTGLELDSVEEVSGVYQVNLIYLGQNVPVYVTKDGNYVGSLTPLNANPNDNLAQQNEPEYVEVSADDDAVKGDANAPVTIIEFSDFQCPYCERFYSQTLPQLITNYIDTGKVKLVYRDFPLSFHENAQKAAEAAECAGEQGKYWEMHDKLFENQQNLDVESLKKYAKEIGANTNQFNTCLDSGKMADEIDKDMADGSSYGVSGTPAFFINGRLVSGAQPFSAFQQIIEEELAKI